VKYSKIAKMFHFIPEKNITNDNFYKFDIHFLVVINAAISILNFRHTQSLSLKRRGNERSTLKFIAGRRLINVPEKITRSATWHVTVY